MTWPRENVISQTAAPRASTDGPPRREALGPLGRSEPAESTENGQSSDGALGIIEKRAARLRHANQIRRARYIRLHQVLSKRKGRA